MLIGHLTGIGDAASVQVQGGHGSGISLGGKSDLDIGHVLGIRKGHGSLGVACTAQRKTRYCRRIGYLQWMSLFFSRLKLPLHLVLLTLAGTMGLSTATAQTQNPTRFADNMAERTRACMACHGDQGRAGPDGYYPRLAGKPAGYLHHQLRNFAQGRRHYELMTRLIDPLTDEYLGEMARYFSSLELPYPAPSASNAITPERLAKGQQLVTQGDASRGLPACTQCHGTRLTGVQPNVPGLLGLPLDYLNAQLGAWQTGQRKALAPDCMAEVVKRIPAEDLIAVSSWLARQHLPADTHPAAQMPQGKPLPEALRCGSAPQLHGGKP
jgi:cytochrome c553